MRHAALWVRDAYGGARCVWGCELLRVRDARVVTLKNRRMWCEMRRGATCCVGGARCVWVRDAHYNVISVLGVRDAYFFRGVRVTVPSFIIIYTI